MEDPGQRGSQEPVDPVVGSKDRSDVEQLTEGARMEGDRDLLRHRLVTCSRGSAAGRRNEDARWVARIREDLGSEGEPLGRRSRPAEL